MAIYDIDDLDYDNRLYSNLQPRKPDILRRFFNVHSDDLDHRPIAEDSTFTQDDLCKIVASELEEEAKQFLTRYEKLENQNVRTVPAIEYLAEHHEIDNSKLDIDSRYELLVLLYEDDLVYRLDELIIRSTIISNSANRTYVLDRELSFNALDGDIDHFHQEWNKGQEDPNAILVDKEFQSENIVVLKIYQETSMQYQDTFNFRTEGEEEIPRTPELTTVQYQQLKTIRFQLELKDGETELVFTDSFNGWRRTLNSFFDSVFKLSDFFDEKKESSSSVAIEIEQEIADSIERGDDPVEQARITLDEKRKEAKERIGDLDIPESRKENFRDRIETIEISGSEIEDDQSIETHEFRLIAGLDGLFNSVDIEEGFRDMLKKAESAKQSFVLTISDRPVQFSDGSWGKIGPGSLPDMDQRALQIFFNGEDGV